MALLARRVLALSLRAVRFENRVNVMNPSLAAFIWATVIFVVLCCFEAAGVADLWLSRRGLPTITQFLRQNPGWFFYPLFLLQAFSWMLTYHLFAEK